MKNANNDHTYQNLMSEISRESRYSKNASWNFDNFILVLKRKKLHLEGEIHSVIEPSFLFLPTTFLRTMQICDQFFISEVLRLYYENEKVFLF